MENENNRIRVSIFICAIDEYEIEQVVNAILTTCDPADLEEINIIYSKNSPADYVAFCHSLAEKSTSVKICAVPQPVDGLGEAVYYGYSISKGTHIIGTVADMQLSPYDITKMIKKQKKTPILSLRPPDVWDKTALTKITQKAKRFSIHFSICLLAY